MIKMVAFDFDGTIANTIPMCIEAFQKAMLPYTGYKLTKEEIVQTFGLNEIGMVKMFAGNNWQPALIDFYYYYEKFHERCSVPFPQINDLIEYLKGKGIHVTLITGKGSLSCEISLKKLNMEHNFCKVMTGSEARNNKAESIIAVMDQYAIQKKEFYYVGDAVSDIIACREAGVTCLSAAWWEGVEIEKLKEHNAGFTFDQIAALKSFLEACIETAV